MALVRVFYAWVIVNDWILEDNKSQKVLICDDEHLKRSNPEKVKFRKYETEKINFKKYKSERLEYSES